MNLSFDTLLTEFCARARVPRSTAVATDLELMCGDLNAAAAWLWDTAMPQSALPEMLTGKTVTLAAGSVIPAASIDAATWWNVWASDPREALPNARARLRSGIYSMLR